MAGESKREPASARGLLTGLGRACGGALIFALPMLMTMELWELGASMERHRLVLMVALSLPLLVGIAHRVGFEPTFGWREDLRDASIALGIAVATSAGVLAVLGVLRPGGAADALVGQVAVQTVPAAIGALLARSQLAGGGGADGDGGGGGAGESDGDGDLALAGWGGTIFLMLVGAIFLSLNVAPTEEMVLISYMMTPWHGLALVALSLAIMHAFVYAFGFRGGAGDDGAPGWSRFLRFTLVGYLVCLAISLYVLWTFGRLDALATTPAAMATVVMAFPAAIGAAAARLIL